MSKVKMLGCYHCGYKFEVPGEGMHTCPNCGEDIEVLPPEIETQSTTGKRILTVGRRGPAFR